MSSSQEREHYTRHNSTSEVLSDLTKPGTAKPILSEATMSSSFLPVVVPPTYFTSQLTPEITIAVIISVLIASAMSVIFLRNRRLPPMNQESMLGTIGIFMIGTRFPLLEHEKTRPRVPSATARNDSMDCYMRLSLLSSLPNSRSPHYISGSLGPTMACLLYLIGEHLT
jgi:hypothetical protein